MIFGKLATHLGRLGKKCMDKSFWEGKNVLITGHTGFKGAWLSLILSTFNTRLAGISADEDQSRLLWNSVKSSFAMDSHLIDVTNIKALEKVFFDVRPEIVFHLAAQPLVYEAYVNPTETLQTNIMGTVNILECIKTCKTVKSAVIVTSDKVYDDGSPGPYKENDSLGGGEIYSASKAATEIIISAYRNAFESSLAQCGIATARAGNVFGGGDGSKNRVVPDLFAAFESKQALNLRNPSNIRPWQHIFDLINGYTLLAQKLYLNPKDYEGAWNFSNPSMEISVNSIVSQFASHIFEITGEAVEIRDSRAGLEFFYETKLLSLNSTKARTELGWLPKYNLAEAIEETTAWYIGQIRGRTEIETASLSKAKFRDYLEKK